MTAEAPKALRPHIGLLGRRNVGKSSLLNALTRQASAIVSAVPGTTTDPLEKAMELLPLGPVLLIDTAGLDDEGALGAERVAATRRALDRLDVAVLVAAEVWGPFEEALLEELSRRGTRTLVVFNKQDRWSPPPSVVTRLEARRVPSVRTQAERGEGVEALRQALCAVVSPELLKTPPMLSDLVPPGELAVLVVPVDQEAPKGRLIAPQVQAIRDLLDGDAMCLVVKERELRTALAALAKPPRLVVTDSQAFLKVAADTPDDVPLTSFSILLARAKGDLHAQVEGAVAIDALRPGDRVLVAEACSHHAIGDDIGRVKIPRWLTQYVGGALDIVHVQGHDFPDDLASFKLAVLCGGCTITRREVLGRIERCRAAGVPVTNYGLTIAYSLGIFERALGPFPAARDLLATRRQRAR